MSKFNAFLDRKFKLGENGTNVKTEVMAGLTTFLAMAYILTVNPSQIFYAGAANPMWASVFIATALGAVVGTLLMALYANMPLAQAPGMGINAMLGGLIGGGLGFYSTQYQFTFGNVMLLTLISGVLFLILTLLPFGKNKETGALVSLREKIFDSIPAGIRTAIPVGIGLFIAFIGMQNAGLIITNGYTQTGLIAFSNWELQVVQWASGVSTTPATALVCLFGLIVIAVLSHFKVSGAVIFGIIAATILGIPLGVTNFAYITGSEAGVTWKFWESFANFFSFDPSKGSFLIAFTEGFNLPAGSIMTCVMLIITLCMLDMFDTMGTVLGCATKAGLLDETGKPLNYNKCMIADSVATCAGSLFGTSTVTTFVESGTGVAAGGKTGLTALTTTVLFFLSLFLLPVFACIPSAATASALIYVGVLMMSSVKNIDFSDIRVAVPAFLTIILMPLAYSITGGIGMGFISYVVISLFVYVVDVIKYAVTKGETAEGETVEKPKFPITVVMAIVAVLFVVYFFVPMSF